MLFDDPHDSRKFGRFAKCDANGSIVAMVEFAANAPDPDDSYVDISPLGHIALDHPAVLATVKHVRDKRRGR